MDSASAIILDFDGVVVDSLEAHLDAWQAAVNDVFPKAPRVDRAAIARLSTRAIAQILAARFGDPSLARRLSDVKEHLLVIGQIPVPLLPGAERFIACARAAKVPLGIASNSRGAYVRGLIAHHNLGVEIVVCGDEVRKPKPDPGMFWECANRLGVAFKDRATTYVLEDSIHGLEGAVKAGMVPVGIASLESPAALVRGGAKQVFAHLGDAADALF